MQPADQNSAALIAQDADVRLPGQLAVAGLVAADDPLLNARLGLTALCRQVGSPVTGQAIGQATFQVTEKITGLHRAVHKE